jgi:hypothetical protein
LDDELILHLLEFGLLVLDDIDEELILKTLWRDSEVNDADLDTDLGQIVRVRKLSGNEELKVLVVGHHGVTQLDRELATVLNQVLDQEGLKGGVQGLFNVLQEDWHTHSD